MSKLERYTIEEEIGQGGMATVYRAHDRETDSLVALKELRLAPTLSVERRAEIIERFNREVDAATRLDSDKIVEVLDAFSEDGREFIVMELLEGQTLASLLAAGALPPEAAVGVAEQILEALTAAQQAGVVHRDLKPENIFVMDDGTVKVADFGIARISSAESGLTRAGQVLGTVGYMPPEQIRGATVDGRSDIFALGVILYQMLSGVNPFLTEQPTTTMYRISYEEPPTITPTIEGALAFLTPILVKAMAKDPDLRYQSAEEMLADLREGNAPDTTAILAASAKRDTERSKVVAAAPVPAPRASLKIDRRMAIALAVAGVLALGGIAGAFAISHQKNQEMARLRSEIVAEGRRVDALITRVAAVRAALAAVSDELKAEGATNAAAVARWDSQMSAARAANAAKAAQVERYNLAEQQKATNSAMEAYSYQWCYNTSGQWGYWPVSTGITYSYEAKHKKAPKAPKAPRKIVVNLDSETVKLDQITRELGALRSEVASQSAKARYFQVALQRVGEAVAALDKVLTLHRSATAGLVRRDGKKGAIVEQAKLSGLGVAEVDPQIAKMSEELGLYLQNYGVSLVEIRSAETSSSTRTVTATPAK